MVRILTIILLALNGLSAVIGGLLLITDPSGYKLGLYTSVLQYSPFDNFLIPGILLTSVIGLGSFIVCALVILRVKKSPTWVIISGFILAVWISIQILMLRDVQFLQITFAINGITLMLFGIIERRKEIDAS